MEYVPKEFALKNGMTCVIRRADAADAERVAHYKKVTSGETPYLPYGPEDIRRTPEDEAVRIERWNAAADRLRLLAEVDGRLAGVAVMYANAVESRLRHRCGVDITLYQRFCGMGVGTLLLGELLSTAKAAGYEQAELDVVSANAPAIGLYRKLGFETVGTIPRAMKYRDGSYADFLLMIRPLA